MRPLQRAPRGGAITWSIEIEPSTRIAMDRDDLHELLGSLLENALKWTTSRVRIAASGASNEVVSIEDDGPGVPENQFDIIRQRGASLSHSSDNAGLGLAIAEDIADAYGYQLAFYRSEWGGFGVKLVTSKGGVAPAPQFAEAAE